MVEFSGDIKVTSGVTPIALSSNAKVDAGAVIVTGTDGQMVLERGKNIVVVAPNSQLVLPSNNKKGFTRVLQQAGTALYQVKKKKSHHFSVETPYMAAVVKGTKFTINLKSKEPSVSVLEGTVEVADLRTQQQHTVRGGEILKFAPPSLTPSAPSGGQSDTDFNEANISLDAYDPGAIDYQTATGGLVSNTPNLVIGEQAVTRATIDEVIEQYGDIEGLLLASGASATSEQVAQIESFLSGNDLSVTVVQDLQTNLDLNLGLGLGLGLGSGEGGEEGDDGVSIPPVCELIPILC